METGDVTTEPTITIPDSPDSLFYLSLSHTAKRYSILAGNPPRSCYTDYVIWWDTHVRRLPGYH